MNSEDFRQTCRDLLGKGWQTRLSEMLEVDGSTVRRWIGTGGTVPSIAVSFLSMMCHRQKIRGARVYDQQPVGRRVAVQIGETEPEHSAFAKMLLFPGVTDKKRLPSIISREDGGAIMISMGAERSDDIQASGLSYILTRHPDSWHLDGYRLACLANGHAIARTKYGDHHYSLLAHRNDHPPLVLHHIATHSGVNRRIWSAASSPAAVFHQELDQMFPDDSDE